MFNAVDTLYDYQYDDDDPYVYPGTKVLVNRFNCRDQEKLSEIERTITFIKASELEANPIEGHFDLNHLKAIHHFLFCDIYDWAGTIRQKGFISKGESVFCKAEFIEPYSSGFFKRLKRENYLVNLTKEEFVIRLAFYIAEINALHPFREGNGRTQRIFANQLARQAGWNLNLSACTPKELCDAYVQSMSNLTPLIQLLNQIIKPL